MSAERWVILNFARSGLNVTLVKSCVLSVMERVLTWARAESRLNEHVHGKKNCNLTDIPKLDDASNAGGSKSSKCSLIVTEGDSAKALATSGLSVVGRDNFGVFHSGASCSTYEMQQTVR